MSGEKEKEKEKEQKREVKKAELKRELMQFQDKIDVQIKKMKDKKERIEKKLEK